MRELLKWSCHWICTIYVLAPALLCRIEILATRGRSYRLFITFGQVVSLLPGLSGHCLRRAFYCLTLDRCSRDCKIGFGAIFTQPNVVVHPKVYVGTYALIGHAVLCEGALIGSRASVLSSGPAHRLDSAGKWTEFDPKLVTPTTIGYNVWVGEGAIIAAEVGANSMVSAGSVVGAPVPPGVMVAGNPARFVKRLIPENNTVQEELKESP